eukprot:scaffold353_cov185-Amphora_coffeaeformis.AAC.79
MLFCRAAHLVGWFSVTATNWVEGQMADDQPNHGAPRIECGARQAGHARARGRQHSPLFVFVENTIGQLSIAFDKTAFVD